MAFVTLSTGEDELGTAVVAALGDSPLVLTEPVSDAVVEALGVKSFPVVLRVDEPGTVVSAHHGARPGADCAFRTSSSARWRASTVWPDSRTRCSWIGCEWRSSPPRTLPTWWLTLVSGWLGAW